MLRIKYQKCIMNINNKDKNMLGIEKPFCNAVTTTIRYLIYIQKFL